MSKSESAQAEVVELPSNVKKLSPEHALIIENLNLKMSLISEQITSAQKDLETIKGHVGNYINNIKSSYFQEEGRIQVDPFRGLISLEVPEDQESKSESDQ